MATYSRYGVNVNASQGIDPNSISDIQATANPTIYSALVGGNRKFFTPDWALTPGTSQLPESLLNEMRSVPGMTAGVSFRDPWGMAAAQGFQLGDENTQNNLGNLVTLPEQYQNDRLKSGYFWDSDPSALSFGFNNSNGPADNAGSFGGVGGAVSDIWNSPIPLMFLAAYTGGALMGGEGGAAAGAEGAGTAAGANTGDALFGTSAANTYGTDTAGGGGMWDWLDSLDTSGMNFPEGAGGGNLGDPGGGAFDMGGSAGVFDSNGNPLYSSPFSLKDIFGYGKDALGFLNKLAPTGAGKSTGGGILGNILGDPAGAAFNATPFLLALAEANRQQGITDPTLAKISGLQDQAANNETGLVASALGPYNRQTMAGRDALMADQSQRGIRGSSFGDQGITNYDMTRGQGAGELTAKTTAASLGLQGGLLDQILKGQTQAATNRNMLLGAGLNASGRLFQPQSDPFGLKNLLGV